MSDPVQVLVPENVDEDEPRPHFLCKGCGIRWPLALPIDISAMIDLMGSFSDRHEECKIDADDQGGS